MKILLLTNYFPPEIGAASHLYYDLATKLVEQGHQVGVVTGFPRYNIAKADLAAKYTTFAPLLTEHMGGVIVYRIKTAPFPKYIPIARGLDYLTVSASLLVRSLLLERYDVVLVYSPPLFLGITAWVLQLSKNIPFVFNVQDIFPQSAIDLGLLTNKSLISIFSWLEARLYRVAAAVTVHSAGNAQHVARVTTQTVKAVEMPNWVDTEAVRPGPRSNTFSQLHGLDAKFVVSFAGTLGYSQDLGVMVRAAERLQDLPNLVMLIVGDGAQKEEWVAKSKHLANVQWLPMQSREVYPSVLQASDICLATLKAEVKTPVVPSKILSIMSAGKAILATMDLSGDAPDIIEAAGCGYALAPEADEQLAEAIRKLYNDRATLASMGSNGRNYVLEHFSLEACSSQYVKLFEQVVAAARKLPKTGRIKNLGLLLGGLVLAFFFTRLQKGKQKNNHGKL
jgi:glycosyltransferase involved in cell wall biosynthesis